MPSPAADSTASRPEEEALRLARHAIDRALALVATTDWIMGAFSGPPDKPSADWPDTFPSVLRATPGRQSLYDASLTQCHHDTPQLEGSGRQLVRADIEVES